MYDVMDQTVKLSDGIYIVIMWNKVDESYDITVDECTDGDETQLLNINMPVNILDYNECINVINKYNNIILEDEVCGWIKSFCFNDKLLAKRAIECLMPYITMSKLVGNGM